MRAGKKPILSLLIGLGVCAVTAATAAEGLVVVAHPDTPALNEETLQKIYLGKVVEVNGHPIVPVNLNKGNVLRIAFMRQVLAQDDDKFIAYWTVRRYIGKGSPPREFATVREQLEFVRATPGAVGYLDEGTDNRQGVKTLLKKP
jgi:ABC-type phosphate transport system substrate-binding protein